MFCAADLRGDSVRIGGGKFNGSMRLSDTCSVTFDNHRVPADRSIEIPSESALQCMAQYQRSWFQLLLGESYLARIEHLHRAVESAALRASNRASLNELAFLREVLAASAGRSIVAERRGFAVARHRRDEAAHLLACPGDRRRGARPR